MSSTGKAFNAPHNRKQVREAAKWARNSEKQARKAERAASRAQERAARRARIALAQT
jgi:hypothetical protein